MLNPNIIAMNQQQNSEWNIFSRLVYQQPVPAELDYFHAEQFYFRSSLNFINFLPVKLL